MSKIVIIGCGGHAKSIVDIIEKENKYEIVGFVDRELSDKYIYKGYKVIGTDNELNNIYKNGVAGAVVGIGYLGTGRLRAKIYEELKAIGYELPTVIDPSAIIASDVEIGEGTVVGKRAVINSAAKIGKMTIINSGAIIEHDCQIADYTHVSVGTVLCGGVKVGKHCFIGAGTTVIQCMELGDDCIVGAGSTVLGTVGSGLKVYGIVKS